jgi:hypothetical protein
MKINFCCPLIYSLESREYGHEGLADCLDNVGSLTSHNPTGLHGLLLG